MLKLQNELNIITCGKDWVLNICNGKNGAIKWNNAIIVEAGELLDSMAYKWWKKDIEDMPNAKMEIIDLLHFTLSKIIVSKRPESYFDDVENICITEMHHSERLQKYIEFEMQDKSYHALFMLFKLADYFGMDLDQVYALYIKKNVLNIFRQNHGYADGTYIKIWDDREDNYWIDELFDSDDTYDILMRKLEKKYEEIGKEK
jgi:dimeric dUTPase (all-alpha-NTP-PPase superfamily)